jgi:cell division protein FtsL
MVLLDVKIKELLQKVEEAGEEGRVQEATELQNEVDKLQEELTQFKEVSKVLLIIITIILIQLIIRMQMVLVKQKSVWR